MILHNDEARITGLLHGSPEHAAVVSIQIPNKNPANIMPRKVPANANKAAQTGCFEKKESIPSYTPQYP